MDEERKQQIHELTHKQVELIKKIARIAKLPAPERANTSINRAIKALHLFVEIRNIQVQKASIALQPMPRFQGGGIIGEGSEYVVCGEIGKGSAWFEEGARCNNRPKPILWINEVSLMTEEQKQAVLSQMPLPRHKFEGNPMRNGSNWLYEQFKQFNKQQNETNI